MTRRDPRLTIRPAEGDDALAIAQLAAMALEDKYRPALGRRAVAGIAALVRRDLATTTGTRRWAAEIDGRLAGSVSLVLGRQVEAGFLGALAHAIGWPWAIRGTLVLGLLGHSRIAADEAYVDELAVADWARRRGVARALLEACQATAEAEGCARLTLWVSINYEAARSLYADAGFREVRRRRWPAGRLLFRAPGAIFMERWWEPPRAAPAPLVSEDRRSQRSA